MKRKILMFFHLLSLWFRSEISFKRLWNHDYDEDKYIIVVQPIKDNIYKSVYLCFNVNLIPVNEYEWQVVGVESRLVNKYIFSPRHKAIYEYDLVDDQFYLIPEFEQ